MFKSHFANRPHTAEHHAPANGRARPRGEAVMAPAIIVGAILMFVLWDTSDH